MLLPPLSGSERISVLAVRLRMSEGAGPEAWHVEVQSSFRPMNYLTPLTKRISAEKGKGTGAAIARTPEEMRECVEAWIEKKYEKPKIVFRKQMETMSVTCDTARLGGSSPCMITGSCPGCKWT